MTKKQPRIPVGPPQDCSFSVVEQEIERRLAIPTESMPSCECEEKGQPMTEFGVMHLVNCEWLVWFRSTGGCQGDV